MTFDGHTWTLRREAPDFSDFGFAQRFHGGLDSDTIRGEWLETAEQIGPRRRTAWTGRRRLDARLRPRVHADPSTVQVRLRHRRQPARGIGFAIARRRASRCAVFAHQHAAARRRARLGADPRIEAVLEAIGGEVADAGFDLVAAGAPEALFAAADDAFGHVDILVCNHASSGPDGALHELSADILDPTGRSTPAPRCCSPRPSRPSTTAARAAAWCS